MCVYGRYLKNNFKEYMFSVCDIYNACRKVHKTNAHSSMCYKTITCVTTTKVKVRRGPPDSS